MKEYYQHLNQYYDKIYVLSLPRLKERIEYINKVLAGLNFEFFWGTDKQETSLEKLKSSGLYTTENYRVFYKKPSDINLGMLCCSLGHLHIYENIVQNGYGKTLILEDDVVPQTGLADFPQIVAELPADWEIFYLGYEKNESGGWTKKIKQAFYKTFNTHAQLNMSKQIYSNYYPRKISKQIARAGFHDCTHAYSVSQAGAAKLLTRQKPVSFHPDNLLSYMIATGEVKGYISRKKLFNQLSAFNQEIESLTG